MNFEKIEQAYTLILENVQNIQNALATNFYDALIEHNGIYLDGDTDLQEVLANDEKNPRSAFDQGRVAESLSVYPDEGGPDGAHAGQSSIHT